MTAGQPPSSKITSSEHVPVSSEKQEPGCTVPALHHAHPSAASCVQPEQSLPEHELTAAVTFIASCVRSPSRPVCPPFAQLRGKVEEWRLGSWQAIGSRAFTQQQCCCNGGYKSYISPVSVQYPQAGWSGLLPPALRTKQAGR